MMIIYWRKIKPTFFVIRTLIHRILCFRQFYDVIVVYLYHQDSFVFFFVYKTQTEEVFIAFVDLITNLVLISTFSREKEKYFTVLRNTSFFALLCCWKMKIFHCLKIRIIGLKKFSFVFFPSSFFCWVKKHQMCKIWYVSFVAENNQSLSSNFFVNVRRVFSTTVCSEKERRKNCDNKNKNYYYHNAAKGKRRSILRN